MDVFLSWSGDRSREVASTLQTWLPRILPLVSPWMSSDLEKGRPWAESITSRLEASSIGIICLTAENTLVPWLLFEAGAIASHRGARTCTLLLDVKAEDVGYPLGIIQHTTMTERDLRALVGTINSASPQPRDDEALDALFEKHWPDLDVSLRAIAAKPPVRKETRGANLVHFMYPVGSASEFYNRLLSSLAQTIPAYAQLQVHPPGVNAHQAADGLLAILNTLGSSDAVIAVPRDLQDLHPQRAEIKRRLDRPTCGRVLFVDRRPPGDLLEHPRVSYVGVNNQAVGFLAGGALAQELRDSGPRLYVCAQGPGGRERSSSFIDAVGRLDAGAEVAEVPIRDSDRWETRGEVISRLMDLLDQHPDSAIGFFAGNDETATTACHQALKLVKRPAQRIRVVGCDATREMRQWTETQPDVAVATVTNALHATAAINKIRTALTEKVVDAFIPSLYPESRHKRVINDPAVLKALPEIRQWAG